MTHRHRLYSGEIGVKSTPAERADVPRQATRTAPFFVVGQARTGWNQATHNDVFLQTTQVITQAAHRRLGQYASCFLERRRRDKRFRGQGSLGNPQQNRLPERRDFVVLLCLTVFSQHQGPLNLLATLEYGGYSAAGAF